MWVEHIFSEGDLMQGTPWKEYMISHSPMADFTDEESIHEAVVGRRERIQASIYRLQAEYALLDELEFILLDDAY